MSSENNLDPILKKHLGRVEAPAKLWNHVRGPIRAPRPSPLFAWAPVAALLAITAGGWMLWQQLREPQSVEAKAVAALDRGPEDLGLRTENAVEVRAWLKENGGFEIPLPPKHSPVVRIIGASMMDGATPIAQISYQVGQYRAELLVAKDPTGATTYPKHDVRDSDPYQAARVSSWSMKGQSYTLAWSAPGEFRTACLLCHATEPGAAASPNMMN